MTELERIFRENSGVKSQFELDPEGSWQELHMRIAPELSLQEFKNMMHPTVSGETPETSIIPIGTGADVTKGTGFDAWLTNMGNSLTSLTNAVLGTDFGMLDEDVATMVKAYRDLNLAAQMAMMGSVTGKASDELRKLLEKTQVPSAAPLQNPEMALAGFRAAKNLANFFVAKGQNLIETGQLDRNDVLKVKSEISGVKALIPEYEALINAFESKYGSAPVNSGDDLRRFFGAPD